MTDYEIELLATAVAQKVAAALMPPPPAAPVPDPVSTWEQLMEQAPNIEPRKKRGWPKGKPRGRK